MLSETVVSTLLEASITGGGLVLAVYALITPISEKLFTRRKEKLENLLKAFEEEKAKLKPDSSFKHLQELGKEIKKIRIFPRYLGIGILGTFGLFMLSALLDWGWLVQPANRVSENDPYLVLPFMVAVVAFLFIGLLTITEIYDMMSKEFEEIKKRQKEVKKASANLSSSVTVRGEAEVKERKPEPKND